MSTPLDDSSSAVKIRARDVRMDFAIADERGTEAADPRRPAGLQSVYPVKASSSPLSALQAAASHVSQCALAGLAHARAAAASASTASQPAASTAKQGRGVPGAMRCFRGGYRAGTSRSGWRSPRFPKRRAPGAAEQFLHLLGLNGFGQRYRTGFLSGGMRQQQ